MDDHKLMHEEYEEDEDTKTNMSLLSPTKSLNLTPMKVRKGSKAQVMTELSESVEAYYHRSRPSRKDQARIRQAYEMVQTSVALLQKSESNPRNQRRVFGRIDPYSVRLSYWEVFMFGSQTDGTCACPDSNVDIGIALELEPNRSEIKQLLTKLCGIISRTDESVLAKCLSHARYPIIKITNTTTRLSLCVSFADSLVYQRNEVMKRIIHHHTYTFGSRVRSRDCIRKLIVFVKHWSRSRGINNSFTGYINSFGFLLFVIKFVQWFELTRLNTRERRWSLAEIVHEFFKFYVCKFNWGLHCVSIMKRLRPNIQYGEHIFDPKVDPYCVLQVVDPVNIHGNVGAKVGWNEAQHIKFEFIRAVSLFERRQHGLFDKLCDTKKDDAVQNCNLKFDIYGNGHVVYESFDVSKNCTTDTRYPYDPNVKFLLNPVAK